MNTSKITVRHDNTQEAKSSPSFNYPIWFEEKLESGKLDGSFFEHFNHLIKKLPELFAGMQENRLISLDKTLGQKDQQYVLNLLAPQYHETDLCHNILMRSVLDIVDMVDNFAHIALQSEQTEIRQSAKDIAHHLTKQMKAIDLQRIEAIGQPPQNELHRIVKYKAASRPEERGTVTDIMRHGFKIQDHIVRKVDVAVGR